MAHSLELLACEVPGCRRTRKPNEFSEWLCPEHWALVPKQMRRVLSRLHRRIRKYGLNEFFVHAERTIWQRIKRAAIEEAMGLRSRP